MKGEVWKWTQVEVRGSAWAPPDTWCHPTCKVGDQIIVLNRSRGSEHAYSVKNCWRGPQNNPELVPPQNGNNQQAHAIQDRDENVNGRRGALNARKQHQEEAPSNAPASTSREHVIKVGCFFSKTLAVPDFVFKKCSYFYFNTLVVKKNFLQLRGYFLLMKSSIM